MNPIIDVIAFAPHPDDAELYCAGTLLELRKRGYTIGIIDLTEGELSTRGTPDLRIQESERASVCLGLNIRQNLSIPDGDIANTEENRLKVIRALREHRPSIIFLPYPLDRHPDHGNASALVREAMYFSGIEKIVTRIGRKHQQPFRPSKAYYYMMTHDFKPLIIVDISDSFKKKMEAIRCYKSQFSESGEDDAAKETYISHPDFMESLIARSRRLGFLIGVSHAEGFEAVQPFGVNAETLLTAHPV